MFEHAWASDVSGLRHWRIISRWQRPESNMEYFLYNYTIVTCLLTIFGHNYYAQPIYYTDVSKCCESVTNWCIPLTFRSFLCRQCLGVHLVTCHGTGARIHDQRLPTETLPVKMRRLRGACDCAWCEGRRHPTQGFGFAGVSSLLYSSSLSFCSP